MSVVFLAMATGEPGDDAKGLGMFESWRVPDLCFDHDRILRDYWHIDTTGYGLDCLSILLVFIELTLNIMNRKVIRTDQAPAPVGPYNQAIAASGQLVLVKFLDPAPAGIVGARCCKTNRTGNCKYKG